MLSGLAFTIDDVLFPSLCGLRPGKPLRRATPDTFWKTIRWFSSIPWTSCEIGMSEGFSILDNLASERQHYSALWPTRQETKERVSGSVEIKFPVRRFKTRFPFLWLRWMNWTWYSDMQSIDLEMSENTAQGLLKRQSIRPNWGSRDLDQQSIMAAAIKNIMLRFLRLIYEDARGRLRKSNVNLFAKRKRTSGQIERAKSRFYRRSTVWRMRCGEIMKQSYHISFIPRALLLFIM